MSGGLALRPSSRVPSDPPRQAAFQPLPPAEWQRLWMAITHERQWQSLALVPAGAGAPAEFTLDAAMWLAQIGMRNIGAQIHVANATELAPEHTQEFVRQLRQTMASGLVLLALPPVSVNAVAVPLAQAASSAVLCVLLRRMRIHEAKRTVAEIGQQHFIGAVTFG